jgi:hypothetical protein
VLLVGGLLLVILVFVFGAVLTTSFSTSN